MAEVDPSTGRHTRAFVFLGKVPAAVLAAAKRGRATGEDPRVPVWTASDAAVLREYWGPRWRWLLTPRDPPAGDTAPELAAALAEGGGDEFDDFGELDLDAAPAVGPVIDETFTRTSYSLEAPTYVAQTINPEDTVFDLRLKLSTVARVPLYRQHFFYYVNETGPVLPYRITLDGAPVAVNWRDIGVHKTVTVAGIDVDQVLEEKKEGLHVEALDTFTLVASSGVQITSAYWVDLYSVLPPLVSPERPNDGLAEALRDQYSFDLLWYGALIKWWPMMDPDSCVLALTNPKGLAKSYPRLDPPVDQLEARWEAERVVVERAKNWKELTTGATAVISASVKVVPSARVRVSVRNVFDWSETGGDVAAVSARFSVDATMAIEAGVELPATTRLGDEVAVIASKRHASRYGPKDVAVGEFLSHPPPNDSVTWALCRPIEPGRPTELARLTIHGDGKYDAFAEWREDDKADFGAVRSELRRLVGDTINKVNGMGAAALPLGGALEGVAGSAGSALATITAAAYWPRSLTSAAYKEVKAKFRDYEKAGIVAIRGLQEGGNYTFYFRKGVTARDTRAADRVSAAGRAMLSQYAWLTDDAVASRWALAFPGRVVKISHRTSDLRVEIQGAESLKEFDHIRRYVFSFLDFAAKSVSGMPSSSADQSNVLRGLQENDPNLFDLKKYDRSAPVYSVLCQSGRQPKWVPSSEVDKHPQATRYWNFTAGTPAYYECPNPKYPVLGLRPGVHPRGWCLPCCRMATHAEGSKAVVANEECHRRYDDGPDAGQSDEPSLPDDDIDTRHVLAYGKVVPIGRIALAPAEVAEGLLAGAFPEGYGGYLVGVTQETPSVPQAGWAYALATALSEEGRSAEDILDELADLAAAMEGTHFAIGGGGRAFKSAAELADTIRSAFVRRENTFTAFSPGGDAENVWPEMLRDLARVLYRVEVVELSDPSGKGSINMLADKRAIMQAERIVVVSSCPAGVYPLAMFNARLFLRTSQKDQWMVARYVFSPSTADMGSVPDKAVSNIKDAFGTLIKPESSGWPSLADLTAYKGATLVARLINMHNLCWGVLFKDAHERQVYIPVEECSWPVDGHKASFSGRPRSGLPAAALLDLLKDLNAFLLENGRPPAARGGAIHNAEGKAVGYRALGHALNFYHDPEAPGPDPPALVQPYSTAEVDESILTTLRGGKNPEYEVLEKKAARARAKNRLYRRFVAEFNAALASDRDMEKRSALIAAISGTRFRESGSLSELRETVNNLLEGYPDDAALVKKILAESFARAADPNKSALAALEGTVFGFDRTTLERLRELPHDSLVGEVHALMAPRVIHGEPQDVDNIFVSGSGPALAIPSELLDVYCDILASDITNPWKDNAFTTAAGVFDPMVFIRRPGERLVVMTEDTGAT